MIVILELHTGTLWHLKIQTCPTTSHMIFRLQYIGILLLPVLWQNTFQATHHWIIHLTSLFSCSHQFYCFHHQLSTMLITLRLFCCLFTTQTSPHLSTSTLISSACTTFLHILSAFTTHIMYTIIQAWSTQSCLHQVHYWYQGFKNTRLYTVAFHLVYAVIVVMQRLNCKWSVLESNGCWSLYLYMLLITF